MQLIETKKDKSKTKGSAPRTARGKRSRRGGKRSNAGRPSLYPGKDTSRHATGYFTEDGWNKLHEIQDLLLKRTKREDINAVTVSDALEEAVHKLHKELTRSR